MDGIAAQFSEYIAAMVSRGGPTQGEYETLNDQIRWLRRRQARGAVPKTDKNGVLASFVEAFSLDTVKGSPIVVPTPTRGISK